VNALRTIALESRADIRVKRLTQAQRMAT